MKTREPIQSVGSGKSNNSAVGRTDYRAGDFVGGLQGVECFTCVHLCDLSPVCGSSLLLGDLSLSGCWQRGCGCCQGQDE